MVNGAGWDLLNNGSMIEAAYEVYNGTAAFNGHILGLLYILFQGLLFYKTKKVVPGFIIGIMFLALYFGQYLGNLETLYITPKFMVYISVLLILQFGGWLYSLTVK